MQKNKCVCVLMRWYKYFVKMWLEWKIDHIDTAIKPRPKQGNKYALYYVSWWYDGDCIYYKQHLSNI